MSKAIPVILCGSTPEAAIWGGGIRSREFLYMDDIATGWMFAMGLDKSTYYSPTELMQNQLNVGFGLDVVLIKLVSAVTKAIGYEGMIRFNLSKPDGDLRKWMESSRLNKLGCKPLVGLQEGLANAAGELLERLK